MWFLFLVISQCLRHKRWTYGCNIMALMKLAISDSDQTTSDGLQTYFFWVSPAFTLILRTSRTSLSCLLDHDQNDDLMCFNTDDQESEGPSQRRLIFRSSPMSSSVKTRNVFVRFRPTPSLLRKPQRKDNINLSITRLFSFFHLKSPQRDTDLLIINNVNRLHVHAEFSWVIVGTV